MGMHVLLTQISLGSAHEVVQGSKEVLEEWSESLHPARVSIPSAHSKKRLGNFIGMIQSILKLIRNKPQKGLVKNIILKMRSHLPYGEFVQWAIMVIQRICRFGNDRSYSITH